MGAVGHRDPWPLAFVQLIWLVRSSRSLAVSGSKVLFCSTGSENSTFGLETAEKRLDLTSYMSYKNAEGLGSS